MKMNTEIWNHVTDLSAIRVRLAEFRIYRLVVILCSLTRETSNKSARMNHTLSDVVQMKRCVKSLLKLPVFQGVLPLLSIKLNVVLFIHILHCIVIFIPLFNLFYLILSSFLFHSENPIYMCVYMSCV